MPVPVPGVPVLGVSVRLVLRAVTGALPETYRAAPPFPGLAAGNRRAITDVDRGIIAVSSSYSTDVKVSLY